MGSCTGDDTRVNQKIIYVMSYFSEYHDGRMINEIYQGLKDINYVFHNHRRFAAENINFIYHCCKVNIELNNSYTYYHFTIKPTCLNWS